MPVNSYANYPMSWKAALKQGRDRFYKRAATRPESDIAEGSLSQGNKGVLLMPIIRSGA